MLANSILICNLVLIVNHSVPSEIKPAFDNYCTKCYYSWSTIVHVLAVAINFALGVPDQARLPPASSIL